MIYEFDRYVNGDKMAEGARISTASTEVEAREKAQKMFSPGARSGEMENTIFVLCGIRDN